jgi:3',5'-nucleoside bisphosphate phosphatase
MVVANSHNAVSSDRPSDSPRLVSECYGLITQGQYKKRIKVILNHMHPAAAGLDLQSHSLHSDGELEPAAVVEHAARAGVSLLALTDHDTVAGVPEAVAAGERLDIKVIPAVEISAVDGDYEDLHVLGYGIDPADPVFNERLREARDDRHVRAELMIGRLEELGFEVDRKPLQARREAGSPLGRPHLAAAVLSHPANAARLVRESLGDVSSFIPAYLIPGAPAYAGRIRPRIGEAIGWIHDAGGVAVWAHPFWDIKVTDEVLGAIERFVDVGLDGVEVFYVTHDGAQTVLLADRCAEQGLLSTASADFHGPDHRLFNRFLAYEMHGRTPDIGVLDPNEAVA